MYNIDEMNPEEQELNNKEEQAVENDGFATDASIQESGVGVDDAENDVCEHEDTSNIEIESVEKQLENAHIKIAELEDQYIRKQAEFENFRKRMQREKSELAQFANRKIMTDLLEVIDNFERALTIPVDKQEFQSLYDGMIMTEKQFTSMLEKNWGLIRFSSEGEEFDPQKHEAVSMETSAEVEQASVVEEYQAGYVLHETVLRTAKVKVCMPES